MHTTMAVTTRQGDSRLVRSSQGEASLRDTSTLRWEEPGVKLATFWLPVNPLYLLSNMQHTALCTPLHSL